MYHENDIQFAQMEYLQIKWFLPKSETRIVCFVVLIVFGQLCKNWRMSFACCLVSFIESANSVLVKHHILEREWWLELENWIPLSRY